MATYTSISTFVKEFSGTLPEFMVLQASKNPNRNYFEVDAAMLRERKVDIQLTPGAVDRKTGLAPTVKLKLRGILNPENQLISLDGANRQSNPSWLPGFHSGEASIDLLPLEGEEKEALRDYNAQYLEREATTDMYGPEGVGFRAYLQAKEEEDCERTPVFRFAVSITQDLRGNDRVHMDGVFFRELKVIGPGISSAAKTEILTLGDDEEAAELQAEAAQLF